ncbi:MATE family efflux transporter [Empedobacter falsenii]
MSSNKTIAKNTMFLYFRMFFNMGVSLFTSRIVLKTLGVEDYGIYNLVGGVVVLFSFLNTAMSSATQRYLNFAIAKKNIKRVNEIFCTSINIHLIISVVVLVLGETIGLWFLNYKLNIPPERMYAANWVYQMSLLTTIIDITRIPYNSIIIAYQRMSFYAYVGIFETIMKLVIVYMLLIFKGFDYLIVYGILLMFVNFFTNFIYRYYCIKNYQKESAFHFYLDKPLMKEMSSFSGWNLLGQVANVGASQGIAMVLNIFIGVTVNAAMGIATQVNAAVYSFISNFQVAFNPQITQTYAKEDFKEHVKLVFTTSKLSFFLMAFLAFPVLMNTDFLLHLWLGSNLPTYVVSFTQIVLLISLIDALSGPLWMSAHAIGNIKIYQIYYAMILILNVPIAYLVLWKGASPIYVLVAKLLLNFLAFCYRFYYINSKLRINKSIWLNYLSSVLLIIAIIILFTFEINFSTASNSYLNFINKSVICEFVLILMIATIGLNKVEKRHLIQMIKNKISK